MNETLDNTTVTSQTGEAWLVLYQRGKPPRTVVLDGE
jgi:hypothetical protein